MKRSMVSWAHRLRELARRDDARSQILIGGFGGLLIKTANTALAFGLAIVLARTLGPDGYGIYSFALALLMLVGIPSQLGVPQLVVRETAKADTVSDWGLMRGLWRWANVVVITFSSFVVVALASAAFYTWGLSGPRATALSVGLPLIPLVAFANVRAACLRGLRKVVLGQLPESVLRPGLLLLLLAGCLLTLGRGFELTPSGAMGLHVVAALLALTISVVLLRETRPPGVSTCVATYTRANTWRAAVIPLAMFAGLQVINAQADLIVVGIFQSNREVGVYRAVAQLSLLVVFGFHVIAKVTQPHFARMHELRSERQLQRLLNSSMLVVTISAGAVALFLISFGGGLLNLLFGPEFHEGRTALAILALGKVFYARAGVLSTVLNMSGRERDTMNTLLAATVANVILNVVLVPYMGIIGAAVASALSFVLSYSLLHIKINKNSPLTDHGVSRS